MLGSSDAVYSELNENSKGDLPLTCNLSTDRPYDLCHTFHAFAPKPQTYGMDARSTLPLSVNQIGLLSPSSIRV